MAFRLRRERKVQAEIRQVIAGELNAAASHVKAAGRDPQAIHEARKSLKKARAAIRLIEDAVGPSAAKERRGLGEIGRVLSPLRDAQVLAETLDGLAGSARGTPVAGSLERLRTRLLEQVPQQAKVPGGPGVARSLAAAATRIRRWSLSGGGFDLIEAGLTRTLRRGRKAMRIAMESPTPENFHEWRKRVKEHWYHARLLEEMWPEMMRAYAEALKTVESSLGDDHNLVLLAGAIAKAADEDRDAISALIAQREDELRTRALVEGGRFYAHKPRAVVVVLRRLFESRRAPDAGVEAAAPPPRRNTNESEARGKR
jgi:CHAD domain-containing protein